MYATKQNENISSPAITKAPKNESPWLFRLSNSHNTKVHLYCFPYAGGNVSHFSKWPEMLGDEFSVSVISLPGRWRRNNEKSISCVDMMSWEIADAISKDNYSSFIFFGHSMGAILAFEVMQKLRKRGSRLPEHFFASASLAPFSSLDPQVKRRKKVEDMDKQELQSYIKALSGTPAELLEEPELLEHVMQSLVPDLKAIDNWQYRPVKPFRVPFSVLTGREDPFIDSTIAQAWQHHATESVNFYSIDGDHFFVNTHSEQLIDIVKRTLELENII